MTREDWARWYDGAEAPRRALLVPLTTTDHAHRWVPVPIGDPAWVLVGFACDRCGRGATCWPVGMN